MNRRDFLKALSTCTAALATVGCGGAARRRAVKASAQSPNILFCISDDQSWLEKSINADKAAGTKRTIMRATSRTS